MSKVATALKRLYTARDLTPAELSRRAGLPAVSHIYQLLDGTLSDPRLSTLEKLAGALELPTHELVKQIEDTVVAAEPAA